MDWKNCRYDREGLKAQLDRIDYKKRQIDQHRPIPDIALRSIRESMSLEWTYNSNSIEGNSLTLRETKLILEEGITVHGKSLREHFEAVNHQDAIEYVEKLATPDYQLKTADILDIHALVLQRIEKEFAGRFRTGGVRIGGANFVPPNALKVTDLMDELIAWINTDANDLPLPVKIAVFHHRFVWVHPFFDGNGRTVRLVFNLLFMKYGYPPAIILKNDRKKYYSALNRANEGDYSALVLLILQALERSVDIYLSALDNSYEDYQPIANIVREPEIQYGMEYVSLLARQGKIDAFKEGRVWYTSKDAIQSYQTGRQRIRKPKK